MEHRIIVAGIGPGHPAYVLPAAAQAIREAAVLVGGARALADFARLGQRIMIIRGDIPAVMAFIRESLATEDVVAMVSGDPGYYSLLDALRREFPPERISVIPGISSIQFAFARLALPWHDATLLSFHGRQPAEEDLAYLPGRLLGMLTDTKYNSQTIAALLMERGWPPETRAAVCSRLSYEDETIWRTTLEEAARSEARKNCVMVVTESWR
ncbi:MAG: precorrin-6y C5,15-methyltransferase (decarboxylating) subunit CbiE [Schwartzia sp.]|nr:precorrin-6y C5,15-methyltransferase (decarboxylating) subunit CbiE [Schwartzia sp. (in: firmicutes)]